MPRTAPLSILLTLLIAGTALGETTLTPLFDSIDDPGNNNIAFIDFDIGVVNGTLSGAVFDVDKGAVLGETVFDASTDDVGFYLTVGGFSTLYSDPTLNLGLDLFSAFQHIVDPGQWLLVFEGVDASGALTPISSNIISQPPAVVPLPPTVYLMGSLLPILMFMSRRRKRAAAAA